jgi:hypothetical protein
MHVIAAAGTTFCVLLVYLALQVRAGEDPAIGAGPQAQAPAPRPVLVRRVIVRRVVEVAPKTAAGPAGGVPAAGPSGGAVPSGGGSASPAAPAPAPAAAPAAAPAPAPAPVVTRAS